MDIEPAVYKAKSDAERRDYSDSEFTKLDTNQNGFLDREEVVSWLQIDLNDESQKAHFDNAW